MAIKRAESPAMIDHDIVPVRGILAGLENDPCSGCPDIGIGRHRDIDPGVRLNALEEALCQETSFGEVDLSGSRFFKCDC